MTDPLKQNATLVEALGSSLRRGDHALGTVPDLLKRILREEAWREFVTQRGELVEHARFVDFVTTPPLKGLGGTVDLLRRIISGDTEALDLLDRALQMPAGRPKNADVISNNDPPGRHGTSKGYALRRLRKDAPELHAEVLAGRISAHAAMVSAGFRRRTLSVRLDEPESAAKALRKHMTPDQLQALVRLLSQEESRS